MWQLRRMLYVAAAFTVALAATGPEGAHSAKLLTIAEGGVTFQTRIALGGFAMPFKALVCCHCQSLLLHRSFPRSLLLPSITLFCRNPFTYSA